MDPRLLIAAAALLAAAAGGWTLEHWRTSGTIAGLERERDNAIAQGAVLAASVKACSAGVEKTRKLGEEVLAGVRTHLAELRKREAGGLATVASIEALLAAQAPAGAGCDSAWDELEQLHRKAGAPR